MVVPTTAVAMVVDVDAAIAIAAAAAASASASASSSWVSKLIFSGMCVEQSLLQLSVDKFRCSELFSLVGKR